MKQQWDENVPLPNIIISGKYKRNLLAILFTMKTISGWWHQLISALVV
jgi:hypothetical protein